jgi:hypothetical protein
MDDLGSQRVESFAQLEDVDARARERAQRELAAS